MNDDLGMIHKDLLDKRFLNDSPRENFDQNDEHQYELSQILENRHIKRCHHHQEDEQRLQLV